MRGQLGPKLAAMMEDALRVDDQQMIDLLQWFGSPDFECTSLLRMPPKNREHYWRAWSAHLDKLQSLEDVLMRPHVNDTPRRRMRRLLCTHPSAGLAMSACFGILVAWLVWQQPLGIYTLTYVTAVFAALALTLLAWSSLRPTGGHSDGHGTAPTASEAATMAQMSATMAQKSPFSEGSYAEEPEEGTVPPAVDSPETMPASFDAGVRDMLRQVILAASLESAGSGGGGGGEGCGRGGGGGGGGGDAHAGGNGEGGSGDGRRARGATSVEGSSVDGSCTGSCSSGSEESVELSAEVLETFHEMIDSKRSLVLEDFKRVSHDDLEAEAKG